VGQRLSARRVDVAEVPDFLSRMFAGVPEPDLRKITSQNAARLFGFELN